MEGRTNEKDIALKTERNVSRLTYAAKTEIEIKEGEEETREKMVGNMLR